MALQHSVVFSIVFILLIFSTGCINTSPGNPPLPTMNTCPASGCIWNETPLLQIVGDVTGRGIPGGTIDNITFTVGLTDIHNSVDMERLSIVYADAIRTETLRPVDGFRGDPPQGHWSIVRVDKEVGNPNNRLDNEERFTITINPKAPLVPGQFITIDIKPPNGRSLTIRRVAPPTIRADNILLPL